MLSAVTLSALARDVVLASGSPRRLQLLQTLGLRPAVLLGDFAEGLDPASFPSPEVYVSTNAVLKAASAAAKAFAGPPPDLMIAADTIVVLGDRVLEKPKEHDRAVEMLKALSGRQHRVLTAVVLLRPRRPSDDVDSMHPELRSALDKEGVSAFGDVSITETFVRFTDLSDDAILEYVKTGEPLDKAGGYGIQGLGAVLVESISGCYFNVVGLPLHTVLKRATILLK